MARGFGSDNHSGVHPQILTAMTLANVDHAPSYGTDTWSEKAIELFRSHFGKQAEVFFVFNGTAANTLSMRAMVKPFQSILCSDVCHMHHDECGAPEFFSGAKLQTLPSKNGKIALETLKKSLIRRGDQHSSQAQVVSITQPTELGTCYTLEEIREICTWAHKEKLTVHMDGARFANACVTLGCTFKEMTTDLGVDVVSFGGTKNGLLMGEAVVFLNPALAENFKYIRKQSGQLPSKTRFIASSFEAYLTQDLWKEIAEHSCKMAAFLFEKIQNLPGVEITQPRQSNVVFARLPKAWVKELREKYFFYVWDETTFECRLMTSWDTQENDILGFYELLTELSKRNH